MKKSFQILLCIAAGVFSSCLSEEFQGENVAVAPGSPKSEARAAFEAEAAMLGDPGEPGETFSPGEYTPMWNGAVTATLDRVRYTTVPINTHFYYVADWDTPQGNYQSEVIQKLVVAKNLSTGISRCYIATFVSRESYSRWGQSPAKRFRFGGDSHQFHGLLFLTSLDGTPQAFYGYDRGRLLFDSRQDYEATVMRRIREAFGSQGKIGFRWFWLTRGGADGVPDDLTDDECRKCFAHSDESGCHPIDPANPDGKWVCRNVEEVIDDLNYVDEESEDMYKSVLEDYKDDPLIEQLIDNMHEKGRELTYDPDIPDDLYPGASGRTDKDGNIYIYNSDPESHMVVEEMFHSYQQTNGYADQILGDKEMVAKMAVVDWADRNDYYLDSGEHSYWDEVREFKNNPSQETYLGAVSAIENKYANPKNMPKFSDNYTDLDTSLLDKLKK